MIDQIFIASPHSKNPESSTKTKTQISAELSVRKLWTVVRSVEVDNGHMVPVQ
jgi:hypothetical protein